MRRIIPLKRTIHPMRVTSKVQLIDQVLYARMCATPSISVPYPMSNTMPSSCTSFINVRTLSRLMRRVIPVMTKTSPQNCQRNEAMSNIERNYRDKGLKGVYDFSVRVHYSTKPIKSQSIVNFAFAYSVITAQNQFVHLYFIATKI